MRRNLATKLIESHLEEGALKPGKTIALRFDQPLTQDATGTLVMLTLEAMGLEKLQSMEPGSRIEADVDRMPCWPAASSTGSRHGVTTTLEATNPRWA